MNQLRKQFEKETGTPTSQLYKTPMSIREYVEWLESKLESRTSLLSDEEMYLYAKEHCKTSSNYEIEFGMIVDAIKWARTFSRTSPTDEEIREEAEKRYPLPKRKAMVGIALMGMAQADFIAGATFARTTFHEAMMLKDHLETAKAEIGRLQNCLSDAEAHIRELQRGTD